MTLSSEKALFELTLLNAEASSDKFDDVFLAGLRKGIPPEVLTRLKSLWDRSEVIAGEVVTVGRIIIREIVNFLQANPKLAIGLALGAAIGALVAAIPLIGPLLAPISSLLGSLYGGSVGVSMQTAGGSASTFDAVVQLAHKFFELLISIFNAIAVRWTT